MSLIWKNCAPLLPAVITRPEVVCMFSVVVAPVATGCIRTMTMAALAVGPLNPLVALVVDCRTLKPPGTSEPDVRRELQSRRALGQGDEAAVGDLCGAVRLKERSAGNRSDLEEGRRLSWGPGVMIRPEVV